MEIFFKRILMKISRDSKCERYERRTQKVEIIKEELKNIPHLKAF